MTQNAICLCCDAKFFPLAKGTILSLRELYPNRDLFDICFLDIGLTDDQRAWVIAQGVTVKLYDDVKLFDSLPDHFQNYQKSLVVRPFYPKIFPGYDVYMSSDTDVWFQTAECIHTFLDYATRYAPKIITAPTVDITYKFNYCSYQDENFARFTNNVKIWNEAAYGEKIALYLYGRALFSAGLFAMHRESPIWGLWAKEFETVFNRDYSDKLWAVHLAEQAALNKTIYDTGLFVPISSLNNYHAHLGTPQRDPNTGKVTTGYPPFADVGALHLTWTGKFLPYYRENGLLYQQGAYLTPQEQDDLNNINHCSS